MIYVFKYIYTWLLPPAIFVLLLLWLSWRLWRQTRNQAWLALAIAVLLYLSSIQPVPEALLRSLEYKYALPQKVEGDIIVLLGGGTMADVPMPEGWRGQVRDVPAQRLIGAYALHRRTGWPILVSGGEVFRGDGTEAVVMQAILVSLGMSPDKIIMEPKSLNTAENAKMSAEIMRLRGYKRPVLVTSAFHMPRSLAEFKQAGVTAETYPVGYYTSRRDYWNAFSWVPSAAAMRGTGLALKEYMGLAVLSLRNWGLFPI
jgi:uncharacterized SAM-binding protein YcdF (DUF218 family)